MDIGMRSIWRRTLVPWITMIDHKTLIKIVVAHVYISSTCSLVKTSFFSVQQRVWADLSGPLPPNGNIELLQAHRTGGVRDGLSLSWLDINSVPADRYLKIECCGKMCSASIQDIVLKVIERPYFTIYIIISTTWNTWNKYMYNIYISSSYLFFCFCSFTKLSFIRMVGCCVHLIRGGSFLCARIVYLIMHFLLGHLLGDATLCNRKNRSTIRRQLHYELCILDLRKLRSRCLVEWFYAM